MSRGGKKNKFAAPTERGQVDAVTGKIEVTVLDAVQLAFEACTRAIENRMLALSNGDGHRLAAKLRVWLDKMTPHTDAGGVAEPVVPHSEVA